MNKTIIFHIPHDGTLFLNELMSSVIVDAETFAFYHNQMRDMDATLFAPDIPGSRIIKFDISRLLCDVERFIGDDEIMEKYGMGFCYERAYDGTLIKNVNNDIKQRTYSVYKQHHERLNEAVRRAIGKIILVDLHSFSSEIIVHTRIDKKLPDICIGYDEYLSEQSLQMIVSAFTSLGLSVDVNYPYSGSLIPNCIISKEINKDIVSFMVEVNKEYYMKNGKSDLSRIGVIRDAIESIVRSL